MGLFDFFKKSSAEGSSKAATSKGAKDVSRLARLVGNKLAQDYDRQEAIAQLSSMANEDGARALLRRFDFSMEPSITDRDEKEAAVEGVVGAGEAAIIPIRDYCQRSEGVIWPLKCLRRVVEPERYVDELLELLEQFDTEYVRNAEPKVQLINALEEFASEDVRLAVEPFLLDVNEQVRFTSVGTLFAVGDAQSATPLVEAMAQEESLRVRNRIASGLAERAWPIPDNLKDACKKALPETFTIADGRVTRGIARSS
jgi:HEAT repeat protein